MAAETIAISPEVELEDQELTLHTNLLFKELSDQIPDLDAEQLARAKEFCQQQAIKLLSTQRRNEELRKENDRLEEEADTDPYNPNVYSRRGLYRISKGIVADLIREGKTATVIAGDLDRFKDYNDRYDHDEGNKALGLAGEVIKSAVRTGDIVARVHGDEFALLLPKTNLAGGIIIAERIREAITQLPTLLETDIPLSISLGISMLDTSGIPARDATDIHFIQALEASYKRADDASMKGVKQAGKNGIGIMLPDGTIQIAPINSNTVAQPAPLNR